MKELDLSSHIIQHFRHNDKPSRCLREANVGVNDFFAASYASPCGDWGLTREKSRGFTCCKNGVLASSYDIVTNYMCIYLSEL